MYMSSTSKLKVTYVEKKDKFVKVGLLDSYAKQNGDEIFFWECACIKDAFEPAKSLEKGDRIIIEAGKVQVETFNSKVKGTILAFRIEVIKQDASYKQDERLYPDEPEEVEEELDDCERF